jgi:hypothetical protein
MEVSLQTSLDLRRRTCFVSLLGRFLQGLILQKRGVPIGWSIAASLLGGLLGGAMNGPAATAMQTNEAWRFGKMFFLIWFRLGIPIGLGLGIMTGAALIWLRRHPIPGDRSETVVRGTR